MRCTFLIIPKLWYTIYSIFIGIFSIPSILLYCIPLENELERQPKAFGLRSSLLLYITIHWLYRLGYRLSKRHFVGSGAIKKVMGLLSFFDLHEIGSFSRGNIVHLRPRLIVFILLVFASIVFVLENYQSS